MATTLLLVRHGETDWNRERRFQGHADRTLNDTGRLQARELAGTLAGEDVTTVYTSPLARAVETAEIVADRLGLGAPRGDRRLMEIDVGSWTGLSLEELQVAFPEELERWRQNVHPGWTSGETYEELSARVLAALVDIAAAHAGEAVVVVGHGGTLRVALAGAAGLDVPGHRRIVPPLGNCSVHRVLVDRGSLRVD